MKFTAHEYKEISELAKALTNSPEECYIENLLMENRLSPCRVDSYYNQTKGSFSEFSSWKKSHQSYLNKKIIKNGDCFPCKYPNNYEACPETFFDKNCVVKLKEDDLLIRLVKLRHLFKALKDYDDTLLYGDKFDFDTEDSLFDFLESSLSEKRITQKIQLMFRVWNDAELRHFRLSPKFAAVFSSIKTLFTPAGECQKPGELRDRLGLSGFSSSEGEELKFFILKYTVEAIPEGPLGVPALAAPTCIDFSFYDAFYPYPSKNFPGRPVWLGCNDVGKDCQRAEEVVHAPIDHRPEHLINVVSIPLEAPDIYKSRQSHCSWLQNNNSNIT